MIYRENGQFKTNYKADNSIFPILQDRIAIIFYLFVAFIVIPIFGSDFFINSMMIPFLIFALAAIGLNILTGFTGQISLGTGAFMGVGAYSCYKLVTIFPDTNVIFLIVISGFFQCGHRHGIWPAVVTDQGILPCGDNPCCPVLFGVVLYSH